MATIRKRGSRFHAQIRKNGHRTITKTFTRKADAETWAKQIESEIERGIFVDATPAQQTTLSEALNRYEGDILPTKKGAEFDRFRNLATT